MDLRQQQTLNSFVAHRGAIRALAVDEAAGRFFTGSADGDIKARSKAGVAFRDGPT